DSSSGGTGGSANGFIDANPIGIACGLLSALFYTAFLVGSSRTATDLPPASRSMIVHIGSLTIAMAICPTYIPDGIIIQVAWVGPFLGLAIMIPVFLIANSAPKLPHGLTTIMAASELPAGIVCAAIFLGEAMPPTVFFGVIVVLFGIVLSESDTIVSLLRKHKQKQQ
ncbi:MAG: hypothetical protein LBG97_00490, partial [Coriobacteriales bacterium]|nr:hypothetical protein [Coriobacteriales bacterium]